MPKRNRLLGLLLLLIFLIVVIVYGCRPSSGPAADPIADAAPISCLSFATGFAPQSVRLNPELPWVPGQIIFAGEPESIQILLESPRLQELELRPVVDIRGKEGEYQQGPSEDEARQESFAPGQSIPDRFPEQAVTLLQIGNSAIDVPSAVQLINDVLVDLNNSGTPVAAFPSPNYLTANPWVVDAVPWVVDAVPWVVDAVPWVVDAVPWVVDAVPWVVDAVPWNDGINPNAVIQAEIPGENTAATWQQWALIGEQSIDLYSSDGPARTVMQDGDGVDVVIFDTSPFDKNVKVSTQDLIGRELCTYHPDLAVDPAVEHGNTAEHGYFAAGLSRLVAPNSHHHLVRVLNEDGAGDLFSFISVLDAFGAARGGWENAVVNLSMNLREADDVSAGEIDLTEEQINQLKAVLDPVYHPLIESQDPIGLEIALIEVVQQGGVVVASAGNGSDLTQNSDVPTGMPALWDFTIAAAGTNAGHTRSCFSNQPEPVARLFAPAGDGDHRPQACDYPFPDPAVEPDYICPAVASAYDCEFALTSVVSTTDSDGNPQFSHWMGTSFAAPLASGTAALMVAERNDLGCAASPLDIRSTMVATADQALVNVPDAVKGIQSLCTP